jgi:hypothetical protein
MRTITAFLSPALVADGSTEVSRQHDDDPRGPVYYKGTRKARPMQS